MSILKKIISEKKAEKRIPFDKSLLKKTPKDAVQLLKKDGPHLKLIAELKRKSPSKGIINPEMTVEKALNLYAPFASALSILTEKNYFGGSLDDLKEASSLTDLPLLRKDFLTETFEVEEARYYGGDFFLLIVAALEKNQLLELMAAGKEYGMPALVEVHTEAELETALEAGAEILGINNRNLNDLSINLKTTENLAARIPQAIRQNTVVISESGLKTPGDLKCIENQVDGVLMGTVFMESPNPENLLQSMFKKS